MLLAEKDRALEESERRRGALAESEAALHRSEQRLRRLFETASDWYWEHDTDGRLTFVSPQFEVVTGIGLDAVLGKRLNELTNSSIEREAGMKVRAATQARQPFRDLIHSLCLADGRIMQITTSGIPMFEENGDFLGYCGMSKDYTAQLDAETALRDSEQQGKQLLEAAADYYWEHDTQHRYVYVSPHFETLTGIPASAVLGKRLMEVPGVSVDPEMGRLGVLAMKARQPFRDMVYSRKSPDGRIRWFKVSGAPGVDHHGNFKGYRGIGAEITAHVETEAAARLAQQRLHEAVAHVSQAVVVYDAADCAIAFNQAFTDLHRAPDVGQGRYYENTPVRQGASFHELAKWQLQTGFYAAGPDDAPIDMPALLAQYQNASEHTYHVRDGRWMMVVYRLLPGEGKVGLWTDVTAIKRAEHQRRELEQQLHHSQRLEALGTLAGGVAHEINNALVPVLALTKMVALKLPEGSRERQNLRTVTEAAERSRDLVSQILAFSRKEPQRSERFDLADVTRRALRMMRASLPATIRVEETISAVPMISGDPNQLHQVLVNLMTNAAHAIDEAMGTITVRLALDPGAFRLRLSVADNGCGMDDATKARIFEPFFTTKDVRKGTGLGLSVAHGIISEHGGQVEVESTPGAGSCFTILLPASTEETEKAS
jgi:PAS domain S-box-containing protein